MIIKDEKKGNKKIKKNLANNAKCPKKGETK